MVDGYDVGDKTLGKLHQLGNLKQVTFSGSTGFTYRGFKGLVGRLREGNWGLSVDVVNPRWEGRMSEREVEGVRGMLGKVGGGLVYVPVGE